MRHVIFTVAEPSLYSSKEAPVPSAESVRMSLASMLTPAVIITCNPTPRGPGAVSAHCYWESRRNAVPATRLTMASECSPETTSIAACCADWTVSDRGPTESGPPNCASPVMSRSPVVPRSITRIMVFVPDVSETNDNESD